MQKVSPIKLDYAPSHSIKFMPERRWLALTIVIVLASIFATFLLIWPATNLNGRGHSTFWKSDYWLMQDGPDLTSLLIVLVFALSILTVVHFIACEIRRKLDARRRKIDKRPGFSVGIPQNNPSEKPLK